MSPSHVVSLGLAEELKANGWPQEGSTFYWAKMKDSVEYELVMRAVDDSDTRYTCPTHYLVERNAIVGMYPERIKAAATLASELMERMPEFISVRRNVSGWHCELHNAGLVHTPWSSGEKLPDALAKLALALIREGKMTF